MPEKNTYVYKPFLSLNIPHFSSFFLYKLQKAPEKKPLPLSQQPPSKNSDPAKTTLFETLVEGSASSSRKGVHSMTK